MSDKQIKIKAILSTESFEQDVQKMTMRLQQLQKTNTQLNNIQSSGSTLSPAASYASRQYNQSSEQILRREAQELDSKQRKETMALMQKQRELKKIQDAEGAITAEKQKQIDLLNQEINLKARNVVGMESNRQDINSRLNDIKSGGYRPAREGTDGPDKASSVEMFKGLLKSIGVGAIINGALNIAQGRIENERNVLAATGVTAQVAGRGLQEQFGGQGSKGFFYASERQRAMQMAAKEQSSQSTLDLFKTAGAAAGGFALGGPLGTIGALGGLAAYDSKYLNRFIDKPSYNKVMTKEGMEKYEANLAALEVQDPTKSIAYGSMNANMGRNRGLERSLGLTGRQLYGENGGQGWMANAMNPYGTSIGFTQDEVAASAQSLIGAGATSQSARMLTGSALQFQRNARLGNAGQVMGQLSGTGMESSQTDQAVIRLMSEAVKLGVNTSDMPQEMQRFVGIAAELSTQGGGFSKGAAELFGAGVTSFTQSGLQGAKSAYEEGQDRSKSAGGLEGQMGMGFLQGEGGRKAFGKGYDVLSKDSRMLNALNQISTEELGRNSALRGYYADKMGISEEEFMSGMRQKDFAKQTRTSEQQEATIKYGQATKNMTASQIEAFKKTAPGRKLYGDQREADINAFGEAESRKGLYEGDSGSLARARMSVGGNPGFDFSSTIEGMLKSDSAPGITATERFAGGAATGDAAKMTALNKNLDELVKSASKHTQAAELYNISFNKIIEVANKSGTALEEMNSALEQVVKMMAQNGIVGSGQPSN